MGNSSIDPKSEHEKKAKLLENEIRKMLENDNPVEGVYALYGDHPGEENLRKKKKTKDNSRDLPSDRYSFILK